VIVGELNASLSPIDRSSRQKINKETSDLHHTLDQINVVDIYRVFHPTTRQDIFFFCSSWNFLQNRSYFRTQRKSQQIQENQNNLLHCIRSQQNKTRSQEKEPQKIFKHMKTEKHTANKYINK
jgi:DNA-binding transcriptional regulator GbsR (MarR family)